jgi:hypothetical protein
MQLQYHWHPFLSWTLDGSKCKVQPNVALTRGGNPQLLLEEEQKILENAAMMRQLLRRLCVAGKIRIRLWGF